LLGTPFYIIKAVISKRPLKFQQQQSRRHSCGFFHF
jgi:hypothetical protein